MSVSPSNTGSSRFLKWLLIASLGLNVLIVGGAIGAAYKFKTTQTHARGPSPSALGPLFLALGPEGRKELRREMRAGGSGFKSGRAAIRMQDRQIIAALEATPFDAVALRSAVEARRTLIGTTSTRLDEAVLSYFETLDDAARLKAVERMKAALDRRGPRKKKEPRNSN